MERTNKGRKKRRLFTHPKRRSLAPPPRAMLRSSGNAVTAVTQPSRFSLALSGLTRVATRTEVTSLADAAIPAAFCRVGGGERGGEGWEGRVGEG